MNKKASPKLENEIKELNSVLTEIARFYTFRDKDSVCHEGLSISQCYALHTLREAGPMSLNELASYLNLEKSSASRLSRKLMDEGLIKRSEDSSDFRKISLEITNKGKKRYGRVEQGIMQEEFEIFSGFTAKERRTGIELLTRIANTFAKRRGHKCLCSKTVAA